MIYIVWWDKALQKVRKPYTALIGPPQIVNLRFFVSPPQEKFDF